jgi:hypothetical protein
MTRNQISTLDFLRAHSSMTVKVESLELSHPSSTPMIEDPRMPLNWCYSIIGLNLSLSWHLRGNACLGRASCNMLFPTEKSTDVRFPSSIRKSTGKSNIVQTVSGVGGPELPFGIIVHTVWAKFVSFHNFHKSCLCCRLSCCLFSLLLYKLWPVLYIRPLPNKSPPFALVIEMKKRHL